MFPAAHSSHRWRTRLTKGWRTFATEKCNRREHPVQERAHLGGASSAGRAVSGVQTECAAENSLPTWRPHGYSGCMVNTVGGNCRNALEDYR